jgi:hypothetical protein
MPIDIANDHESGALAQLEHQTTDAPWNRKEMP